MSQFEQLAAYAVSPREHGIVVTERDDPELTAIAACVTALRDLDANSAARVAQYVADRHPFLEERPAD